MSINWPKTLDSLRNDFRDVARSYPKLFYARLIAPANEPKSWELLLGKKRCLRHAIRPLDAECVDHYYLYADADADDVMCRHGLQQFDTLAQRTLRTIAAIPAALRDLLNLPKESESNTDPSSWLSVIDAFAAKPGSPDEIKGFARDQYRVLTNEKEHGSVLLVPAMLHRVSAGRLPPEAFPHRWLAVVSPDIATCSVCAIDEALRQLPDPTGDFTIATWTDKEGATTRWLVHDSETVTALRGYPRRLTF